MATCGDSHAMLKMLPLGMRFFSPGSAAGKSGLTITKWGFTHQTWGLNHETWWFLMGY